MTSKFKSWLREKTGRDKDALAKGGYVTTLTPLPATRPNTLTPTTSHDSHGSANSPLFTRLSRELRLAILEEAFGNQNVHMNLLYFDPNQKISRCAAFSSTHATADGYKKPPGRKEVYQWSSSVCHRKSPFRSEGKMKDRFWYDSCHPPCAGQDHCDFYSGERPGKCWIGIMGFLLSCRQAYHEAIDVLYSTNTIHLESTLLCARLDQFIPTSYLARVRSVELVWEFGPLEKRGNPMQLPELFTQLPDANFRHLIARIPALLPSLRKLSIAINDKGGYWRPPFGQLLEWSDTSILQPVDAILLRLPSLQTVELALPSSIYNVWRVREKRKSLDYGWQAEPEPERIWRQLPSNPEKTLSKGLTQGYWIYAGVDDLSWPVGLRTETGTP